MTRLWAEGEPVRMEMDSEGRPVRFRWREQLYRLQRVQQRWQVDSDWWSAEGRVWRDYWAVITIEGLLCVLYYDHLTSEWRMTRAYD